MCVDHVSTLYTRTYPICIYCLTMYKNMEFVVFAIGVLTKNLKLEGRLKLK